MRLALGRVFVGTFILLSGCDRSDPAETVVDVSGQNDQHRVSASSPAETILNDCIQHYQSLESYQDRAFVELRYQQNGQSTVDRAPMTVAWDRAGRLGLRVYSLLAGPTNSGRWHLRINEARPEFAGQVLSRALPSQLTFDWLLADPVVREELSAGWAGFPPQLDLLLSPKPLSGLVENASRIALNSTEIIDNRVCWNIVIEIERLVYHLWIDQNSKLLRKIELPTQNLPSHLLQDSSISDLNLTIDFQEIQVNHSVPWSTFEGEAKPEDYRLTRFVSRPAAVNLRGYGKIVPAFQLREPGGRIGYDSRPNPHRKVSVLMWLADHSSCQIAAEQLHRAMNTLRQSDLTPDALEFVSVWAEPLPPSGMTFEQLQSAWKLPGRLVLDSAAAGRDLFQIEEAPTLIILDEKGALQLRDVRTNPLLDLALPTLIQRIVEGQELASNILQTQDELEKRFNAEVVMAAATDQKLQHTEIPASYPPGQLRLTEVGRNQYPSEITLLFQDSLQAPWVLLADGSLNRLGPSLVVQSSYQTTWEIRSGQKVQVVPNSDSRLFAYVPMEGMGKGIRRVDLYDTRTNQSAWVNLPPESNVVDTRWLDPSRSDWTLSTTPEDKLTKSVARKIHQTTQPSKSLGNWLAIATDTKQIVLYDWETKEQFSGSCPEIPVTLIDYCSSVVMQDGKVEPIQLSENESEPTPSRELSVSKFTPGRPGSLGFQTLRGPWGIANNGSRKQSVAFGLVADDEPVLFILDSQLRQTGRYWLPSTMMKRADCNRICYAQSPGSGDIVWAIQDDSGTVHLFKGDGSWSDHFRLGGPLKGIALIAAGDRLNLLTAFEDQVISYQLD